MKCRVLAWLVVGAWLALPACKSEEECTKARHAAANAWGKVRDEAGRFKFQGVSGYDEMTGVQKTTHRDAWTAVEQQAGLVFESFAFERITWTTAVKSRDRVVTEFNGYFDKDKYSGFKGLLDTGLKRFSEAESACR